MTQSTRHGKKFVENAVCGSAVCGVGSLQRSGRCKPILETTSRMHDGAPKYPPTSPPPYDTEALCVIRAHS
jgi:hypothetical protein